jgi:mannose/fructose/N-acetylgalactosamine-specific phosphotransferase system component IIC
MAIFDTKTLSDIILVALAGGIIGLDRTAAGQFMISQPVVAGPLIGWMLGDATTGLIIGIVLELIWLMDIPVGTFVPADSTFTTVWATAVAVLASAGKAPLPVMGFCILLTVALVPITMRVENYIRKWNSRLAAAAEPAPGEHAGRRLSRAHLSGIAVFFLKSFVLYLVLLPPGLIAAHLFNGLPVRFQGAMSLFIKLLPLLGIASVVRRLSIRTADGFLLVGFVTAAAVGLALRANFLLVMLVAATATWVGVKYREGRS